MQEKKLSYSLTSAEVNYLLTALNKVQIVWVQQAKELTYMIDKLQNPDNKDEMEKEQFEELKTKFEKKTK